MTPAAIDEDRAIGIDEYRALAEFRYQIRRFLRFSEEAAKQAGVEPQQHQLLLAVKGMPADRRSRIGEIAERLQIQHHSAVELVDRLSAHGLIIRKRSPEDRREVLISLTAKGERLLRDLSVHHRSELRESLPNLVTILRRISGGPNSPTDGASSKGRARK